MINLYSPSKYIKCSRCLHYRVSHKKVLWDSFLRNPMWFTRLSKIVRQKYWIVFYSRHFALHALYIFTKNKAFRSLCVTHFRPTQHGRSFNFTLRTSQLSVYAPKISLKSDIIFPDEQRCVWTFVLLVKLINFETLS